MRRLKVALMWAGGIVLAAGWCGFALWLWSVFIRFLLGHN